MVLGDPVQSLVPCGEQIYTAVSDVSDPSLAIPYHKDTGSGTHASEGRIHPAFFINRAVSCNQGIMNRHSYIVILLLR